MSVCVFQLLYICKHYANWFMYEQQRIRVKENGYVTFLLVCGITILCIRSYDMVNRVWGKKKKNCEKLQEIYKYNM